MSTRRGPSTQSNRLNAVLLAGLRKEAVADLSKVSLSNSTDVGLADILNDPDLSESIRSFNPSYEQFVQILNIAPVQILNIAPDIIATSPYETTSIRISNTLLSDVAEHSPEWGVRAKMIKLSYSDNPKAMARDVRINVYALQALLPFLMELEGLAPQVRVTPDDAMWNYDGFNYSGGNGERGEALADIMVARMEGSPVSVLYEVQQFALPSVTRSGGEIDLSEYERTSRPRATFMTSLPPGIVVDRTYLEVDYYNPNGIRYAEKYQRGLRFKKYTGDTYSPKQPVSSSNNRTDWLIGLMNQSRIRSGTFACAFAAFVETTSRRDMTQLSKFKLAHQIAPP